MTAAQHLQTAKVCVTQGRVDEAKRHLARIPPGSPEAIETTVLLGGIEAAAAAAAEARQAKLRESGWRQLTIIGLQAQLTGLGYELTASPSATQDEIEIVSADFSDTDRRVRFLAQLRGKNSAEVCNAGFRTVRLKSSGVFAAFDERYSLECQ
jgi:hypothetical protein